MVEGEDKNKKDESKGFAGLSSLVSDVDTSPPPVAKKGPVSTSEASSSPPPPSAQTAQSQFQPRQQQTYQEPSQPSSGSSGGKWVLGIAAVLGVLWLIGQADKHTTSSVPTYSPPVESTAPTYSPPEQSDAPSYLPSTQPEEPSRPVESEPPIGQDIVLSTAQIRYCLAEDIRLNGAKSAVNNYIDADVERFNAMVADYNSRCGSFQYQTNNRGRNDLISAQRDIEPYRSQLEVDGRARFALPLPIEQTTPSVNYEQPTLPAPLEERHQFTAPDISSAAETAGTLQFKDYPSVAIYSGSRAEPDITGSEMFRTRIRWTKRDPVNFAGEYVLSTWGCGLQCVMGVAVNARTGKVVSLPGSICCWKGNYSIGELGQVIFRENSRLLVLGGLINEQGIHGAHFYELRNDEFVYIKTIPVEEKKDDSNLSVNSLPRYNNSDLPATFPDSLTMTYETSFDCSKAQSVPELLICHDPTLAAADRELSELVKNARRSVSDRAAFTQRLRNQWNYREKNCRDIPCVAAWFKYQIEIMNKIAQTGDANAR